MNTKKINIILDNEIQKRIENSDWSYQVVSWVFTKINHQSRVDRIVNIASVSFPLLAAALLFLILAFGITSKEIDNNEQQITNIADIGTLLNDSQSLSYDLVDYYVDNSVSGK